ncbi:MAG TPA: phosphoribosylanthranilate isomerase [Solirubrobacteraceae bacterium]|nr:phosphoribosylanthranilate isomerase [Solirubrobacteraceae bacterium]
MSEGVPKIKFCGITSVDDAGAAVSAGAWAIGMILWPGSPRACSLDAAAAIAAAIKRKAEIVGVFVNPTLDEVAFAADAVGLSMVQLHGDEGPVFATEVARRTGCKVIKAARVAGRADIQAVRAFTTDYHLLDSRIPGRFGGSGESFDWELVRSHRGRVPVILSGGLTPENVADAIAITRPFAVDVASGVESGPGVKDHEKLRAFADAVSRVHVIS